jgi:hypothetical protein
VRDLCFFEGFRCTVQYFTTYLEGANLRAPFSVDLVLGPTQLHSELVEDPTSFTVQAATAPATCACLVPVLRAQNTDIIVGVASVATVDRHSNTVLV